MNRAGAPIVRVDDPFKDEKFTLESTMELVRRLSGCSEFDLDVAACEQSHKASHWYSKTISGLENPWWGRVFCNPPFTLIEEFMKKAMAEAATPKVERIAMILPANRCEQPFWQDLVEPVRDGRRGDSGDFWLETHFLPTRIRYGNPDDPTAEKKKLKNVKVKGEDRYVEKLKLVVESPPFGSLLLVWRKP